MGVLGAIGGGAVGGLLGQGLGSLFGKEEPTAVYNRPYAGGGVIYGQEELDKEAGKSYGQYTSEATAPLQEGAKIQSQIAQAGSPELSAALKARAGKSYQSDINRLARQQKMSAFDEKQARDKEAYSLGYRRRNIDQNIEAYEAAAKEQVAAYDREMDSARNSAISAVLGQAGVAIGSQIGKNAAGSGYNLSYGAPSSGPSLGNYGQAPATGGGNIFGVSSFS